MNWLPEKEEFEENMRRLREQNKPAPRPEPPREKREPHWTDAIRLPNFWTGR